MNIVVELVGGGTVINGGYPVYFLYIYIESAKYRRRIKEETSI